jgi:hypothetical protein
LRKQAESGRHSVETKLSLPLREERQPEPPLAVLKP